MTDSLYPPPPLIHPSPLPSAINACLNRRLVTLLGVAGIGKSALAAAVCRYMGVRRNISDGIVFVRLQGKQTLDEMIQAIIQGVARQLPAAATSSSGAGPPPPSFASAAAAAASSSGPALALAGADAAPLERDEEWLFTRLRNLRVLLVLDHMQELQASQDGINAKIFLSQLFDATRYVKVMVTTSRPLDLHTLPGAGVGESLVSVGPLNFRNTVRLFSRLCPHLHTARDRRVLLESLVWPEDQAEVTIASRDVSPRTCAILERLGEGHPARCVRVAGCCSGTVDASIDVDCLCVLAQHPPTHPPTDPSTNQHHSILKRAYEMSEREVLALLEESQEARRAEETADMATANAAMAMRGGGAGGGGGGGGGDGGQGS